MTKVVFYRQNGTYYGFKESGHADVADFGEDVLCAALSAMSMLVINTLETVFASDIEYTVDEKTTEITMLCRSAVTGEEKQQYALGGVIYGYFLQLNELMEDYPDALDVDVAARPL